MFFSLLVPFSRSTRRWKKSLADPIRLHVRSTNRGITGLDAPTLPLGACPASGRPPGCARHDETSIRPRPTILLPHPPTDGNRISLIPGLGVRKREGGDIPDAAESTCQLPRPTPAISGIFAVGCRNTTVDEPWDEKLRNWKYGWGVRGSEAGHQDITNSAKQQLLVRGREQGWMQDHNLSGTAQLHPSGDI